MVVNEGSSRKYTIKSYVKPPLPARTAYCTRSGEKRKLRNTLGEVQIINQSTNLEGERNKAILVQMMRCRGLLHPMNEPRRKQNSLHTYVLQHKKKEIKHIYNTERNASTGNL